MTHLTPTELERRAQIKARVLRTMEPHIKELVRLHQPVQQLSSDENYAQRVRDNRRDVNQIWKWTEILCLGLASLLVALTGFQHILACLFVSHLLLIFPLMAEMCVQIGPGHRGM